MEKYEGEHGISTTFVALTDGTESTSTPCLSLAGRFDFISSQNEGRSASERTAGGVDEGFDTFRSGEGNVADFFAESDGVEVEKGSCGDAACVFVGFSRENRGCCGGSSFVVGIPAASNFRSNPDSLLTISSR
jgi:hypothetical protein